MLARHLNHALRKHADLRCNGDFYLDLSEIEEKDREKALLLVVSSDATMDKLLSKAIEVSSYVGLSQMAATEVVAQMAVMMLGHPYGLDYEFIIVNEGSTGISQTWYRDVLQWDVHCILCDCFDIGY